MITKRRRRHAAFGNDRTRWLIIGLFLYSLSTLSMALKCWFVSPRAASLLLHDCPAMYVIVVENIYLDLSLSDVVEVQVYHRRMAQAGRRSRLLTVC